ncbi:o-succinylbenzoate--CoA ligase [Pseudonocardia dioxanivorans CB1190]|uniref:O-succinylbenzoate--CoA ligase n=1 Tax=Pseudonocardia dioxanivorans (strain ATCC 55486 / DSM 44775 / JCM 13855 / CB1190) TaxID=675635 RepID=F4CWT9_PSEUX|nr:class I adenylate-forming enzyme family protein [Pseudonocardia dioxanivorans]AEA23841.1 o-succinylbenzoate--CoA ligase [Pseudonocardia dioxanivorans CB1190]GJF01524.1 3-[(3aS,4S,7aS)-7a-methyl-1,5-dioxo-octahydro-1H- inden-4-yl]propanoyl:CoA ligase [Pseudonocardia sp. D17]
MTAGLVAAAAGTTLDALYRRSIRIFADRTAVTTGDPDGPVWTYRELGERAGRLAAGLAASGVRHGDRVAVLSETRPEFVELYVALARLGVTAITLNIRWHAEEIAHAVGVARPVAFVTSGLGADRAAAVRDRCPSVRHWYCMDDTGDAAGFEPYSALPADGDVPADVAQPSDVHNVLYTSGTTGRAKGAMITQQAAAIRALRLAQWYSLTPDDGFVGWLPLFHTGGDESLNATLLTGGIFCALATAHTETMFAAVQRHRLTWTLLLPGVITDVLHHERRTDYDLSTLRFVIGYANMMPTVVKELTAALDVDFNDAFGQTETSYVLAHGWSGPGEDPHLRKMPTPLMEVRIVDAQLQETPVGVPGECVVRGPTTMAGYLDDPEATAEVFAGGWLHTGDVLVRHDDGTLSYVDRAKYLIKTGGENVYPAEVEQAIAGHPGVEEVCAYGVPDPRWGETVKVVVVRAPGADVSGEEVVAWCRDRLAAFKRPHFVEFVDAAELPRSTTGKLQRHLLAERGADEKERVS